MLKRFKEKNYLYYKYTVMTKIQKITIYGERCSGTNYLETLLAKNFHDYKLTWKYGWKHFFGHENLENSDDTLFICIVRNPVDWINSLYRDKYHIADHLRLSIENFLNKEFYSYRDNFSDLNDGTEIMEDRNIYTGERYKNIFELRHTKLNFLYKDLPKLVKNYIFIKHEDLINNFKKTMIKIKNKGLIVKPNIYSPLNVFTYKKSKKIFKKKSNEVTEELILNHPDFRKDYEQILGYI
ncbi:hypothetical protein ceV_147 [Chrysochromulina ericina virus CeV-01B]|uniref:Uncharacterized protein n=1 Tax=Chrysochromulina ericina virus CeV-01B TaxID=3070830 RepID=A0A0N9QY64_9VIRU|nr:hypothetical protein ceV_147 [Chrysochromulina ericina virus]ALH23053.1 hypothetical protein ceV_147 [Chrysochromulina ericina virus CeV-01B]